MNRDKELRASVGDFVVAGSRGLLPSGEGRRSFWVSLHGSAPRRGCARGMVVAAVVPETAWKRGLPRDESESIRACENVIACV